MKYENLPALNQDETEATVKITNKKLEPNNKDGVVFEIPAEQFSYPVVETSEEISQICGGEDKALIIFNRYLRDQALAEGKNKIRMASTGTQEDIIAVGIATAKNFTFVDQATFTGAEAKEALSSLRTLVAEKKLSPEELQARVMKMFNLG